LTLLDVLVILLIVAFATSMTLPLLYGFQLGARRDVCMNNMHQIGIALLNYNATFNKFPGSAAIQEKGNAKTVHGWSFLVEILPYMEYGTLYDSLKPEGEPDDAGDPTAVTALNTAIKEFQCPDNPNRKFVDPKASPPHQAFTNYKAMGATCVSSLQVVVGGKKPPYCPAGVDASTIHPDGAFYPGSGIQVADFMDGTAHTILVAETIDDRSSRWTVGKEATLVGLPDKVVQGAVDTGTYSYFHPTWFDGTFNGTAAAAQKPPARPYIAYDFSPGGKDAGTYDDTGIFGQKPAPAYGPSSGHGDVVNHLFADSSVSALSKKLDPCAYWFMITKNGADPYHPDAPE
jgi:type II secretory pathway pseudopilin PulG